MDRGFQFSLRVALVLCIMAGVGLIVYQIVGPSPIRPGVLNPPAPAAAVSPSATPPVAPSVTAPVAPPVTPTATPPIAQAATPAVTPAAPAQTPASPGATPPGPAPTPGPETPSAPESPAAATTPAAPAAASGATGPGGQPKESSTQLSIKDWEHTFKAHEDPTRDEGKVSGAEAVIKSDSAVDVLGPILDVYAKLSKGQNVDTQMGSVRVTAKNGDVDKDKGLVHLYKDVKAVGKDFVVRVDHVLYNFTDHTLTTDSHVEMERDNVALDGTKTPAMTLTGEGLDVDMNLQTMKIRSGVVCRIFKVTQDFLAGGSQAQPAGDQPAAEQPMDVVITSDGPMVYQNAAHKATFTKNVKAVYGTKTMTSDELDIQLGTAEGAQSADKTTVNDMYASGNVTLNFDTQVAHGQNFEWHNVTESGTLSGEPCDVTTPQFRMTGKTLAFYRNDSRVDAKGPGQLIWGGKAQPAGQPAVAAQPAPAAAQPTPAAAQPTPAAAQPTPAAAQPTPAAAQPTPAAAQPTPAAAQPTPAAAQPTPAAAQPTPAAAQPTPAPAQPTTVAPPSAAAPPPAPPTAPPQKAAAAAAAAAGTSPLSLNKDQPVTITWTTSMSYDKNATPEPDAKFAGNVVAEQKDSNLACDNLELSFQAATNDVDTTIATGNVDVHDLTTANGRDILCQKLVSKAVEHTVELTAAKDQTVTMTQGLQTITSAHMLFDNAQGTLECPAPGHLTIAAAPQPAGAAADAEPALPTNVDWETAMRFVQGPPAVATFSGNAHAQRGTQSLKADSLRLDFDPAMNPLKITAQGGAVLDVTSAQALSLGPAPAPATQPAAGQPPAGQPTVAAQPPAEQPAVAAQPPAGQPAVAAQPLAGQPAVAAQPAAAAQPPAAAQQPSHWRLTGESLIIEPPQQVISSDVPGTLTMLDNPAQSGTITWQKQMRLESAQGTAPSTAHFVGGVTSDMTGGSLKCEDLKAHFDDQQRLHDAHCEGNVEFDATGDNPWKMKSATADSVFVNGVLKQVISWGDADNKVSVADQARTLLSRRLTLFLEPAPDGSNSIARAIAEEDVSVTYNQEPPILATSDKLTWDRVSDNYTLTGNPARLIRAGLPTSSPTIIIHRPTGAGPGMPVP